MSKIVAIFLVFCAHLGAAPWTLDAASRERIQAHIEAKHQQHLVAIGEGGEYPIDYDRTRINIMSDVCPKCQEAERDALWAKLQEAQFEKNAIGHCYGVTLFFGKYLLDHPYLLARSCAEILSRVSQSPDFQPLSHSLSIHQHAYCHTQKGENPLELNEEEMKRYFQVVLGKEVQDYYVLPLSSEPASFDSAAIYATLQVLKNKLLIVGYTYGEGRNHCIAISSHPQKCFVFDSNLGLFQFPNLETLSWRTAEVLQKTNSRFRWLAAFSFKTEGE